MLAPLVGPSMKFPKMQWTWNRVYQMTVILFIASIPLSKAAGSLAEGLMALCWLAGMGKGEERAARWKHWTQNSWLWGFPLLFLYYVIGGLYSEDFQGWLLEINAKHYWITLPLMWGTLRPCSKTIHFAWWAFVLSNFVVSLMVIWIHWTGIPLWEGTVKIPSPLVQRPRASLFLAISCLWLFHSLRRRAKVPFVPRSIGIPLLLLSLLGLIWMEGRIGQVALVLGLGWMAWKEWTKVKERLLLVMGLGLIVVVGWMSFSSIRRPFVEAFQEYQESQAGYPHSEPEFSSIGMRFTYWNTYWDLLCKNPLLGVGSGDLDQVAKPLFKDHPLEIPFHRPHNQWLELGVHLGFPAILLAMGAWALWWTKRCPEHQFLWEALTLVWFLSTWLDCTWSTQAGLSAFMGLNLTLLLVNEPQNQEPYREASG